MARQLAESIENSFVKGLVTEATGLNFPENACVEALNCVFNKDGSVQPRPGLDYEPAYTLYTITKGNKVVSSFVWTNAGDGTTSVVIVQIGENLHYFLMGDPLSSIKLSTVTALPVISGAPASWVETRCQYSKGLNYVFVTHPFCDPIKLTFDSSSLTVSSEVISCKIRDFEGVPSPYGLTQRPVADWATVNVNHKYNLFNQGWNQTNINTWDANRSDLPSNADVMWHFKNANDQFDISTVPNVIAGTTAAPKGYYILNLFNMDRNTASGLSGLPTTSSGINRPATSEFFAGRLFMSGINAEKYLGRVYFSQIIERPDQLGAFYQSNDPTSEEAFDLLASDGGVIHIPEAGNIIKLAAIKNILFVFAVNGIWTISGSTGTGFTAKDYNVAKISSSTIISPWSFVVAQDTPFWWSEEGIFTITSDSLNIKVVNISSNIIQTFFSSIPNESKKLSYSVYDQTENKILWLFNDGTQAISKYSFNKCLEFNLSTGAFYPLAYNVGPDNHNIEIFGLIKFPVVLQAATEANVIDATQNFIVDSSGSQVVVPGFSGMETAPLKFIVYRNNSGDKWSFANYYPTVFADWSEISPKSYVSYFVTGYKLRGKGLRKFQNNYIRIYSRTTNFPDTQYIFRAIWDYAVNQSTGRYSEPQVITHNSTNYDTLARKLKVRGNGVSVQFMVQSTNNKPFDIIGWAVKESGDTIP